MMDDLISRQAAIDEEIRCTICTNKTKTDRGCDGNCQVDENLHKEIIRIIEKHLPPAQKQLTEEEVIICKMYLEDLGSHKTCNEYKLLMGLLDGTTTVAKSKRTFVELLVHYPHPDVCTYPEHKGKPYYSIKYIEDGECFVGFGTYKPEVLSQYLRDYFMPPAQPEITEEAVKEYCRKRCLCVVDGALLKKYASAQPEQRWIPCSERLPEKEGWYITTVESEKTGKRRIENDLFAIDIALAHGHTPNKFCKDGYRQRTVAWMPFPEPYQTERRADE